VELQDIVEIEEWNEYGELKQHVKIYYDESTIPDIEHKYPEVCCCQSCGGGGRSQGCC
jgi:hypothetical protein